jgi:hypothetical protein
MTSEHGKASVLPAYAVYAGRSVVSSEFRPYFIILLKGVDFIMMISVKDICFGSLLVHSVFLPVPHVSLPHSA